MVKKHLDKIIVSILFAICLAVVICVIRRQMSTSNGLEGFWVTRGGEEGRHYVAYIHGDFIDVFWFESEDESELDDMNSFYWWSGSFVPPEGDLTHYAWVSYGDYNRSNAALRGSWSPNDYQLYSKSPFTHDMEYKNGKLYCYFSAGDPAVFYRSTEEHPACLERAEEYDRAYEASKTALPIEIGDVKVLSPDPGRYTGPGEKIIIVEMTNPNPFGINNPAVLFDPDNTDLIFKSHKEFGGVVGAESRTVFVSDLSFEPDSLSVRPLYNEYWISFPGEEPVFTVLDSEVKTDREGYAAEVEIHLRSDMVPKYTSRTGEIYYGYNSVSVVFYLDGEIVGGGNGRFCVDSEDINATATVLTVVTDYDRYEVFVY